VKAITGLDDRLVILMLVDRYGIAVEEAMYALAAACEDRVE